MRKDSIILVTKKLILLLGFLCVFFAFAPTSHVYATAPAVSNISIDGLPLIPGGHIVVRISTTGDPETVTATIWGATHTFTTTDNVVWETTIPVPDPLPEGEIAIGEITLRRGEITTTRDFTAATMDVLATRVTPVIITPGGQINIEVDAVGNPDNIVAIVNGAQYSLSPGQGLLWSVNAHIPFTAPGGTHTIQIRATLGNTVIERTISHTVQAISSVGTVAPDVIVGGTHQVEAHILTTSTAMGTVYVLVDGIQYPLTHVSGTLWRGPVTLPSSLTSGAYTGVLVTRTGLFMEQRNVLLHTNGQVLTIINPFVGPVGTTANSVSLVAHVSIPTSVPPTVTIGGQTHQLHNWGLGTFGVSSWLSLPAGPHTVRFTAVRDGLVVHHDVAIVSIGITSSRVVNTVVNTGNTFQLEVTVIGSPETIRIWYNSQQFSLAHTGNGIWRGDIPAGNVGTHTATIEAGEGHWVTPWTFNWWTRASTTLPITVTQIIPAISVTPTGMLTQGQVINVQADLTMLVDTVHARLGTSEFLLTHVGNNRWQGPATIPSSGFGGAQQLVIVARTGGVILGTRNHAISVPMLWGLTASPTTVQTGSTITVGIHTVPEATTVVMPFNGVERAFTRGTDNHWTLTYTIPQTYMNQLHHTNVIARNAGVELGRTPLSIHVTRPVLTRIQVNTGVLAPGQAVGVSFITNIREHWHSAAQSSWPPRPTTVAANFGTYANTIWPTSDGTWQSLGVSIRPPGEGWTSLRHVQHMSIPIAHDAPAGRYHGAITATHGTSVVTHGLGSIIVHSLTAASAPNSPVIPGRLLQVRATARSQAVHARWNNQNFPLTHTPTPGEPDLWTGTILIPVGHAEGIQNAEVVSVTEGHTLTRAFTFGIGAFHSVSATPNPVNINSTVTIDVVIAGDATGARLNLFGTDHNFIRVNGNHWRASVVTPLAMAHGNHIGRITVLENADVLGTRDITIAVNRPHFHNISTHPAPITPGATLAIHGWHTGGTPWPTSSTVTLFGQTINMPQYISWVPPWWDPYYGEGGGGYHVPTNRFDASMVIPSTAPAGITHGTINLGFLGTTTTFSISVNIHSLIAASAANSPVVPGHSLQVRATARSQAVHARWNGQNFPLTHTPAPGEPDLWTGNVPIPAGHAIGLQNAEVISVTAGHTLTMPFTFGIGAFHSVSLSPNPVLTGGTFTVNAQVTSIADSVTLRLGDVDYALTRGTGNAWSRTFTIPQTLSHAHHTVVITARDALGVVLGTNTQTLTIHRPELHSISVTPVAGPGAHIHIRSWHSGHTLQPLLPWYSQVSWYWRRTMVLNWPSHTPHSTVTLLGQTINLSHLAHLEYFSYGYDGVGIRWVNVGHIGADFLIPATAPAGIAAGTIVARHGTSATEYPFQVNVHGFTAASITNPLTMPGRSLTVQATARSQAVRAVWLGQSFPLTHVGNDQWTGTVPIAASQADGAYSLRFVSTTAGHELERNVNFTVRNMQVTFIQDVASAFPGNSVAIRTTVTGLPTTVHVRLAGIEYPLAISGSDWAGSILLPLNLTGGTHVAQIVVRRGTEVVERNFNIPIRTITAVRTAPTHPERVHHGAWLEVETDILGAPAQVEMTVAGVTTPLVHVGGRTWRGIADIPLVFPTGVSTGTIRARHGLEWEPRNFSFESVPWTGTIAQGFMVQIRAVLAIRVTNPVLFAGERLVVSADIAGNPDSVHVSIGGLEHALTRVGTTQEWRGEVPVISGLLTDGVPHPGEIIVRRGAFRTASVPENFFSFTLMPTLIGARPIYSSLSEQPNTVMSGDYLEVEADLAKVTDHTVVSVTFNGATEYPLTRVGTSMTWRGTGTVPGGLTDGPQTGRVIVRHLGIRRELKFNYNVYGALFHEIRLRFR